MIAANRIDRAAAIILGLAFTGQLVRLLMPGGLVNGPAEPGSYSLEAVMSVVGSSMWIFAGIMHLLVAVALATLASRRVKGDDSISRLTRTSGILGGVSFLFLSMSHFHGVSAVQAAEIACAASGQSALVTYNLLRVVTLASGMFALGTFLLLSGLGDRLKRTVPGSLAWIGLAAGLLCLLFAFASPSSARITAVTLAAVIAWSVGRAVFGRSSRDTVAGPGKNSCA
jgi:hypothetical protein